MGIENFENDSLQIESERRPSSVFWDSGRDDGMDLPMVDLEDSYDGDVFGDSGREDFDKPQWTEGDEEDISELTEEDKQEICDKTGWSKETVDTIKSKEEAEIYMKADLKEEEIDGKKCLVRSDIDLEQKDEFGQTNRERMEKGNPPLTKDGETVELHHIGQKPDGPLAELTMQEHRGRGNDSILHEKQKESEIDRNEFAKERKQHWESRAQNA